MPDLFYLLQKWWKAILSIILAALAVTLAVTLMMPKKYLATATAAPASAFASDRSKLFNENLEILYSALGTPDDLDLVVGTSKLDTVYLAVVDELKLENEFDVSEKGEAARLKIATMIRKDTRVQKSAYGELKIRVWDKEKERSARIANALLSKLGSIHQFLQNLSNKNTLDALLAEKQRAVASSEDSFTINFDKLIAQYNFLVNNKPPVLLTIEAARTPQWPDKPQLFRNLLLALGISFLFSLLLALYLEKRQGQKT
jgi:uncharacterized protein involved in exopolysaccharide biosynthesis